MDEDFFKKSLLVVMVTIFKDLKEKIVTRSKQMGNLSKAMETFFLFKRKNQMKVLELTRLRNKKKKFSG